MRGIFARGGATFSTVVPAKAGIQEHGPVFMGLGFRRDDKQWFKLLAT
jgi:hypothetical protein